MYFAEDVGKSDQYATADVTYDSSCPLHRRLYSNDGGAGEQPHPGDVHYLLVCQVALGLPLVTVDSLQFGYSGLSRNPYGAPSWENAGDLDTLANRLTTHGADATSDWNERVTLFPQFAADTHVTMAILNKVPGVIPDVEYPSVVACLGRSLIR